MSKILSFDDRPRLFNVDSTSTDIPDSNGQPVNIRWWADRETPPVPFSAAIQGYNPADKDIIYTELYIRELFTFDEAQALKTHLVTLCGLPDTTITEVTLPVSELLMGISALPIGGPQRHYDLPERHKLAGCPFEIHGYVDLRAVWNFTDPGGEGGAEIPFDAFD